MISRSPDATRSNASLHVACRSAPSSRSVGYSRRPSRSIVSPSAAPFTHSRPALAGWLLSPAMAMAPSGSGVAVTPQPTPQYGQVLLTARGMGEQFKVSSVLCSLGAKGFAEQQAAAHCRNIGAVLYQ